MSRSLHPAALCLLLASAAACAPDASFTKLADPEPAAEDTGQPPAPEVDTGTAPLPECPATDGVSATSVDKDITCKAEPDMRPLQAVTEWKTTVGGFTSHPYGRGQPAIGHLTDDNGDGLFGDGDVPDLVATFYETTESSYCGTPSSGMIRAFSGDGNGAGGPLMHWSVSDLDDLDNLLQVMGSFHPAIGDIDADGEPEVIVGGWYGPEYDAVRLIALSHTGEVEWLSPISRDLVASGAVAGEFKAAIYDLNQDGQPEVYAFGRIYDGATGERLWEAVAERTGPMVVVDLENDGLQELITIDGIWGHVQGGTGSGAGG